MKLKLRKIGNSYGVILPHNVITSYKEGAEIEINVITSNDSVITKTANVITNEPNVITSRPNVITKPTKVNIVPLTIIGKFNRLLSSAKNGKTKRG